MKTLDKNVNRKYSFSDYDPNWVVQFQNLKKMVSGIFGAKALRVEHVGSTSIPGMKAKPVIDVLVIVKNVHDLSRETADMQAVGYEWGENYIAPDTLVFFKTGPDGEKLNNIHICEEGAPKVKQFLVKRDFFRAFPEKAKAYSDLKAANAQKYPANYLAYRQGKDTFLEEIEKEAYEWVKNDMNQ